MAILIRVPLLIVLVLGGCASSQTPPEDYIEIAKRASSGSPVDAQELKSAFFNSEDFADGLAKIVPLEKQVLQLIEDQPLKWVRSGPPSLIPTMEV